MHKIRQTARKFFFQFFLGGRGLHGSFLPGGGYAYACNSIHESVVNEFNLHGSCDLTHNESI